jgi:hypothetical protein
LNMQNSLILLSFQTDSGTCVFMCAHTCMCACVCLYIFTA